MSGVPGSRFAHGPSLAGRMAAAIALTAGFYLLALAMVAGLVALAVLPWLHGGAARRLSIISLLIAGGIAVAIVPRRIRFETPGPQLAPAARRQACTRCSPRRRRPPASACQCCTPGSAAARRRVRRVRRRTQGRGDRRARARARPRAGQDALRTTRTASLPERIAAVASMPPGDPDDSPPAIELLTDPAASSCAC